MEPTHMTLSAFDWALVLAFAVFLWFLWVRDFKSRDRLAVTVEELGKTVAALRAWMAETYVTRPEHNRDIDRLEEAIAGHAERWDAALKEHKEECPGRR